MSSAPRTARDRARAELTAEIKATARRHLAEHGSAALSLRAVARDLGMVSSAVYRYFPSRDELLTALIIDAYAAVGQAVADADRGRRRSDLTGRWVAIAQAIRGWAVANPAEYALVYGSPVPGYQAPTDTIAPAAAATSVFLQLAVDAHRAGQLVVDPTPISRAVRSDLAVLREAAPGVPDDGLLRGLTVWTQVFGLISFELFGHLHNVIADHEAVFEQQVRSTARFLFVGPG